jgi:hypothetical protein
MKNIYKHFLAITLFLLLGACGKDFLEVLPGDRLTADDYYGNEEEIRSGTASLYAYPWFSFNDKFYWLAGDCMSGNLFYTYDQEGQYYYFSFNEGNAYLSSGWVGLFRVISYANSLINDMPRIAGGKGVDATTISQALGEARFMRAVAYYFLVEYWGAVPIVENSTELVTSNNMELPRNTKSSVYEFIRRDLNFAIENLKPTDEPGRVTTWSAKGMLAKLYVTMAQNLSDPNSADYFSEAMELAGDIITNSTYTLLPNFHNLFKIENDNNPESLFALLWIKGGYGLGNSLNANWTRSSVLADQQWGGGKGCTYDLRQAFEEGDLRRYSTYMTLDDYYPELNKSEGGYTYQFETRDPDNPDNTIEDPNEVLNHLKKYTVGSAADNNGQVGTDQDAANNTYILRLADVYLIYAEAVLGSNSSTTDAKALEYLNAIRERADLDPKTEITFMDILNERRVEFALESMFWLDIKRFYYRNPSAALNYLNSQKRHYVYQKTPADDDPNKWESYVLDSTTNSAITVFESQMELPIPASELLQSPSLADPPVEYVFE